MVGSLWGVRSPERYGMKSSGLGALTSLPSSAVNSFSVLLAACAHQVSDEAAERMTPIWCQVFGIAWQKAWIGRFLFGAKPAVVAQSTPEVPSDTEASPGWIAPKPP